MKGGVLRRLGNLSQALVVYEAGRDLEALDNLSTYNLSNVITLGITEGGRSPLAPGLKHDLQTAIQQLKREVGGSRSDEWWAWSDLAQFHLLDGDAAEARVCYDEAIKKTGATAEEINRHVVILSELASKTEQSVPAISEAIKAAIRDLKR
jgi:tetratricopeptide (TPR) repeat protein